VSLPAYPSYRDSGVPWLGQVPAHWEVMPLKRAARLCTERAVSCDFPVGLEHVESWTGRLIEAEADFEGEGVAFCPGDILFGKLRPYLAKAWLADRSGEAVGDFHVIRPLPPHEPPFLHRVLLSQETISLIAGSTYGAKMPRASWDFIGSLSIPLPPPAEQRAIAAFLDRECGKMDALVAEQERLIALLKEKRQAVISHAVTKGLDPTAPMKDSGVAWLGQVPAHWQVMPLKRAARLCTERAVSCDFPVGLEHVESWTGRLIEAEADFEGEGVAFCPGDILFGKLRPYLAKAWLADRSGEAVGDFHVIRPLPPHEPPFLHRVLLSQEAISLIAGSTYGAKMPRASWDFIGSLSIPLPPPAEQRAIAAFLDRECQKLGTLTTEAERAIALLKERRAALISAAVTGKIDVRGLVAPTETEATAA
jgi:type I restriction enzyme S subunit